MLAIGNLHYYLKKSMHRKSLWRLKYSNRAVSSSLNYSGRTFTASPGSLLSIILDMPLQFDLTFTVWIFYLLFCASGACTIVLLKIRDEALYFFRVHYISILLQPHNTLPGFSQLGLLPTAGFNTSLCWTQKRLEAFM